MSMNCSGESGKVSENASNCGYGQADKKVRGGLEQRDFESKSVKEA